MMALMATKAVRYGGRSLLPGDVFDAPPRDATVLKAIGKAKDMEPVADAAPAERQDGTVGPPSAAKPKRVPLGRHSRKDMRAAD